MTVLLIGAGGLGYYALVDRPARAAAQTPAIQTAIIRRGDLVIGPDERVKASFAAAGVPTVISDNVEGELWAKLVVNCAYNALSAITQLPYGRMIQGTGVREVMRDVVEETLAVAKASGVTMAPDMLAKTYRIAEAMPTQFSSTAQDLARGKPTVIDHLNGFVTRKGEALGIPTPANRALHALVKLIEAKAAM